VDMSVILPVMNEAENLRVLIPRLIASLDRERITHEIVVIDGPSTDGTREVAQELGARVVEERRRGYAGALESGIAEARGGLRADARRRPVARPGFRRQNVAGPHPRGHRGRVALRAGRRRVLRLHSPFDELVSEPGITSDALDSSARYVQRISPVPARGLRGAETHVLEFRGCRRKSW